MFISKINVHLINICIKYQKYKLIYMDKPRLWGFNIIFIITMLSSSLNVK